MLQGKHAMQNCGLTTKTYISILIYLLLSLRQKNIRILSSTLHFQDFSSCSAFHIYPRNRIYISFFSLQSVLIYATTPVPTILKYTLTFILFLNEVLVISQIQLNFCFVIFTKYIDIGQLNLETQTYKLTDSVSSSMK
jgi:hypothetical protein